jgi:hypothetical protein
MQIHSAVKRLKTYKYIFFVQEMGLTSTSTSFSMWKETPIPMYIEVYFFNWINAAEFQQRPRDVKPVFVEMGPYVFRY